MQLTQQQDEMTSLSRSLSDEISLPSWMNEMLDRSPTGSNDYNHLIFDTPLLQENTSNKNETPEKTPEMLRDWFLSRTNSDQSRITNSSPTRHILSSTTTMDLGHHSPSHSKTQEQITSSNDRHEHLDSWTDKKNNLNEQVYPHPHDNENQVEPLKYNPSLDPNVNIITQQQQKQNDTSSHKRSSTIEQLEISKPSQSNNNDSKRDKDSNDTEALLDDLLHGALPDDEQPLSKRRKTTPPLRIQPMNEKTSDQLLFECLDQEDGFPDDELHSSAKKREKDSNKGKNRATTTTTNENNKSELTSEDLFSLLDSTLPDDEIPIERTKKQKQQQKKLDSDTCEMKDKDRKQIQEHQEKSKNGLIDTTSVVDDNMMLTMESNNVNDDNNDNEEEDMVMTFPIDDTTTNNNNNGNEHDDSDSYDDDMIETLPVNVIAIETNNNHDDDDDDEDMIMTLPTSNVTACNNNNEDDNEDRASTLDNSIEMSIIHDNSTTTNGLDVFDIDTSFPHCKRLKNIHPSDTHSISSLSSVELSPIISVASIKEQQQKETEPWECMHCFFKNTQSLEKCTFCRNLRDTEPEHTVQQSMVPSTPFMEDETLSLMNNSVIPSSQLEQDQLADTGGSLLYYKEEEEEEEEHISKKSIQVMFTGIEIEQAEILFTQLMDIGLTMQVNNTGTDDIPRHLEEGVTHIITKRKEKDKNLCKRTLKYLWGILAGVWIVDVSWLEDCIRQKRWLSEEHYEIAGDITTGFTFAPRKGRLKRVNQVHNIKSKHDNSWLLFHGIVFYFFDKKHPQRENLVRLCLLAGGDVKHRRPKGGWRDNDDIERCIINPNHPIIIVTDKKQLKNKKNANILESYQVRDSKWLLNCISRNELLTQ
ncbi:hypothetical protein BDC45DRAFT_499400 [Circinella umbellata]|nr:hypothetical protein BDC45DRAFT_499400 [Circinella umbellata]